MTTETNVVEVRVGEVAYKCRLTMGALLYLKRDFGIELTDLGEDPVANVQLLYCVVKASAKKNKQEFNVELDDFACMLTPDELTEYILKLTGQTNADEGKKK